MILNLLHANQLSVVFELSNHIQFLWRAKVLCLNLREFGSSIFLIMLLFVVNFPKFCLIKTREADLVLSAIVRVRVKEFRLVLGDFVLNFSHVVFIL